MYFSFEKSREFISYNFDFNIVLRFIENFKFFTYNKVTAEKYDYDIALNIIYRCQVLRIFPIPIYEQNKIA